MKKELSWLSFRDVRRDAGEKLSRGDNRIKMIFATMLAAMPVLVCYLFFSFRSVVLLPNYGLGAAFLKALSCEILFWTSLSAFLCAVALPMLCGLCHMAKRIDEGEEIEIPDVFHSFSSKDAYLRSVRVSWMVFYKLALLIFAEYWTYTALTPSAELHIGILILEILLLWGMIMLWAAWTMKGFLRPFEILTDIPRDERICLRPYATRVGYCYWLGYLPWLALSIATVLILLLADLLPRMLISYFGLCRRLTQKTNQLEEIIHE